MTNGIKTLLKRVVKKLGVGQNYPVLKDYAGFKNVSIAEGHLISADARFEISADAELVEIEASVGSRSFCNFLVFPRATLKIGRNVYFNNFCSINCLGTIDIGENTLFGEGVKLYDHNHAYNFNNSTLNVDRENFTIGKISIGKNCWIGSNVTILNNVVIGDNVIIGANCLIFKSVPSNTIVKHKEDLILTTI